MENRWNDKEAKAFAENPKELRVYSSRLLGQEQDLVLHGGGNTSLKLDELDATGNASPSLFVKGSGWDLETRNRWLLQPAAGRSLRSSSARETGRLGYGTRNEAMLNSGDPNPSVEAILHAIIPFRYVDHTHADAVLAIMNTENGKELIKEIYGDRILIIPYVMPGFKLARMV